MLARRWNVAPWALESAPVEWLLRGLTYQRLEGSVKVTRHGKH